MSESLLGEGADNTIDNSGQSASENSGAPAQHPIYGELKVQWPEGLEEGLDLEPSLKAFVNKEDGNLNFANLIKSFVHGQKAIGSDKVVVPGENASAEQWDAIHEKLHGFKLDKNEYLLERGEDAKIPEEFYNEFKDRAHELRIPHEKAQELMKFYEEKVTKNLELNQTQSKEKMEADIEGLKTEWGEAFGKNLNAARKVLDEFAGEELREYLEETGLGNDTKLVRLLSKVGQKIFSEDSFVQNGSVPGAVTPEEAERRIGEIMANPIYFNPSHPENAALKKEMARLFAAKNPQK